MSLVERTPEIFRTLSNNASTLIVSPTGTGKSTLLPGVFARAGNKILVSAPPIQAVRTLYDRMVSELGGTVTVGYAAEGEIRYNQDTQLVYATAGHVKNMILRYFEQKMRNPATVFPFNLLIVDEIHTGALENALIVSLWSYGLKRGLISCRLIMMSATPDVIYVDPQPAEITIEQPSKPVLSVYLDRDPDLRGGRPKAGQESNEIYHVAARQTWLLHQQLLVEEAGIFDGILVFAAGQREIEHIIEYLSAMPGAAEQLHILPAFGGMQQVGEIYRPAPPGKRKIIIATNLIESSVTIEGLAGVVDTLLQKQAETNDAGGKRLALRYISRASAEQRKGRVGRTRPGICVRLCTEDTFNKLAEHSPPEVERLPIEFSVIELLRAGIDAKDVPFARLSKIESATVNLLNFAMIQQSPVGGYQTTELGNFVPQFPISLHNGTFLYHWLQRGYPPIVGVRVACLIDCWGPYYWKPAKSVDPETHNTATAYHQRWEAADDLGVALKMFDELMTVTRNSLTPDRHQLRRWCETSYLNFKKIKELLHIMVQCSEKLRHMNFDAYNTHGLNDRNQISQLALSVAMTVFSDNVLYHVGRGAYRRRGNATNIFVESSSVSLIKDTRPASILALIIRESLHADNSTWFAAFSIINTTAEGSSSRPVSTLTTSSGVPVKQSSIISSNDEQRLKQVADSLASLDFSSW